MDYKKLVLELLEQGFHPVLQNFVIFDIYFKFIPIDFKPSYSKSITRIEAIEDKNPYKLTYLIKNGDRFIVNYIDKLNIDNIPLQCITIKLSRSLLDKRILQSESKTFEEEIYHFITLLNYNVPKICSFLNLNAIEATRFLPQKITLWVSNYTRQSLKSCILSTEELERFGPNNNDVIPTRMLLGLLSPCISTSKILSLNNNKNVNLKYTHYYIEKYKTIINLAFNPLENPIINDI